MRIAVLGSTGHTGRLVVQALRDRGVVVVACGRSGNVDRKVDVTDGAAVRDALRDVDGVANLAGPFLATGDVPVEAAIQRGIPYVDTTGEQAFMQRTRKRYHDRALAAGVPVVNALAYEYALADLAAKAYLPEGGDTLHVLYRNRGSQGSAGTKKSIARVLGQPVLSWERGALVREPYAAHMRRFETAQGPRDAMSFPGGEALTVPRHTPFATVRSYVPQKPSRARTLRVLSPLARVAMHGALLRMVERRIDAKHRAPDNATAKAEIHLVAEGLGRGSGQGTSSSSASSSRLVLSMGDPYRVTAEVCAEGLVRLVGAKARAAGVVAPAEALPARDVLDALSKRLPDLTVATR